MHRVFVDSNVFYSRTLRDWLGLIYLEGDQSPFVVFWSEDVMAEVVYHLRRKHPDWDGTQIATVRDRLTSSFEVGRVTDYTVSPSDAVTDPDDLHVHAAALACDADILLTCNTKDFVGGEHYDVMTPDDFFVLVNRSVPAAVRAATRKQVDYWGRQGLEVDLPARLTAAGCDHFAGLDLEHIRALALAP